MSGEVRRGEEQELIEISDSLATMAVNKANRLKLILLTR
jgi:hypothetical protein